MCWKTLLLLLLYSDAQATLSHRWTRGELSFLYLFDAYDSFLNIIRNLEGGGSRRKLEALCPPLISCQMLYASQQARKC